LSFTDPPVPVCFTIEWHGDCFEGIREMEESEVDMRARITIMLVGALCGAVAGILAKLLG